MSAIALTFVVPGDNRSGGLRVTARMASLLQDRGCKVRIAHPNINILKRINAWVAKNAVGHREQGWLHTFPGKIESYSDINNLAFEVNEVVVAVGTYMVKDVANLRAADVRKVRYNHGFPTEMTNKFREAWSLQMDTVTVSTTLVAQLEKLSHQQVRAIIPNGIDEEEYFPEPHVVRDAIGTIFSSHPNKAPRDIIDLFGRIQSAFPDVPRIVFSTDRKPFGLCECSYSRYPTVDEARKLYSRSLVWVLASRTEGLPASVLEAMACGAVVISTDNAGSLELIKNGVNGLIVPSGDIEAFLPAIRTVLTDGPLRQRLVAEAYQTVRQFNWISATDAMEKFLRSLLLDVPLEFRKADHTRVMSHVVRT